MFTGLIREMAQVVSFHNSILTIQAKHKPQIGDSIAINGACLTVVSCNKQTFSVKLSPESAQLLAIQNYTGEVHIEPAMKMGDRFEGHVVQGHIDCVATISQIQRNGNSTDFYIALPKEFMHYIIPKGSICIDGISLTINEVFDQSFRLTIIPHTIENTLFKRYKIGTQVNIETDMFARYLYHMFAKKESLSWSQVEKIMATY